MIGANELFVGALGFVHDGYEGAGVGEQAAGLGAGQARQRFEPGPGALLLQTFEQFAERPDRFTFVDGTICAILQEPLGPPDGVVRRGVLRCRCHGYRIELAGRSLVVGIERPQRVDGVPEEFDADRLVGVGRKQVDDAPAARDLARRADDVDTAVAQLDRLEHELVRSQRGVFADRA